jgi:hypothetical protein
MRRESQRSGCHDGYFPAWLCLEEVASVHMERLQGDSSKQKVPSFLAILRRNENDIDPCVPKSIRVGDYTFIPEFHIYINTQQAYEIYVS